MSSTLLGRFRGSRSSEPDMDSYDGILRAQGYLVKDSVLFVRSVDVNRLRAGTIIDCRKVDNMNKIPEVYSFTMLAGTSIKGGPYPTEVMGMLDGGRCITLGANWVHKANGRVQLIVYTVD